MNKDEYRPIFIVGAPRSGTTLTSKILGGHPDIYSPGETHFFEDIWERRAEIGNLSDDAALDNAVGRLLTLFGRFNFPIAQQVVEKALSAAAIRARAVDYGRDFPGLYRSFTALLSEQAGKPRFCDDTPKHLYHLDNIFEMYPAAKAVGLVRDPRDFLCSYKNKWQATAAAEVQRLKTIYHPIVTSLLWHGSNNLLQKYAEKKYHDRIRIVQYENLVQAPEETITALCEFLDLKFTPALLNIESSNSSFGGTANGIFSSSVGRWRTCLSAEEAWWAQRVGAAQMEGFGYTQEKTPFSPIGILSAAVSAPFAVIRGLKANAAKRGPVIGYVLKRLRGLF